MITGVVDGRYLRFGVYPDVFTVCAALGPGVDTLPNARVVGETLATAAVPVPVRAMSSGLPGALSLI